MTKEVDTKRIITRACDPCRTRKIKCSGTQTESGLGECTNCIRSGLTCTTREPSKRRGPRGKQSNVLDMLKSNTSYSPPVEEQDNKDNIKSNFNIVTSQMIEECAADFFNLLYPTMPILHPKELEDIDFELEKDRYALASALCALIYIQCRNQERLDLVQHVLKVRSKTDFVSNPSHRSITTSFFLFACYFGLNDHNCAWYHLREAITFAQLFKLDVEETYLGNPPNGNSLRKLFWLLFVTERAYGIQSRFPIITKH